MLQCKLEAQTPRADRNVLVQNHERYRWEMREEERSLENIIEAKKSYVDVGPKYGISTNGLQVLSCCAPRNPGLPPAIAALAPYFHYIR